MLGCIQVEDELLPADIEALIERRQAACKAKDFKESDRIRDELPARGIVLEDTPKGVVWRKKQRARREGLSGAPAFRSTPPPSEARV